MSKREDITLLSDVLLLPDGKGANRVYIEIVLQEDIPVYCKNKNSDKYRLMPFKVLYDNNEKFWQQDGKWEYYFTTDALEKLKEKAIAKTGIWDFERLKIEKKNEETEMPQDDDFDDDDDIEELEGYGTDYKTIAKMTTDEKIQHLNNNRERLNNLVMSKTKDKAVVTEALVDTAKDATMINHAVLEEAMRLGDDEAKKLTQALVDSTHEMVKTSVHLIEQDIFSNELMNRLVEKSNGTIVQHMTRVYLNGINFLEYYNKLVSTSSAIQKLRISFASKYRDFYHALLPHINIEDIILERVFYRGMRAIPPELFFKWAVGFLIHDIGKAAAVEYHEGESAYDRGIVTDHVKMGYKYIITKTNYPTEASLITGYHHEYYGDFSGYGYFRAYLQQYKKANPDAKQDYCITYELEHILDYKALAYFPAKVLEIIDVYDSVTDPNRVYRKAMTPEEALTMIREEFIEKHRKLDAILFDIFAAFIREKEKKHS